MWFISAAQAADNITANATAMSAGDPSLLKSVMPLLFIFAVLYLLLIRPSQKRIKEHEDMIGALRRGDKIVTGGGVVGTIQKIEGDDILVVEIAPEVKVRVMKDTISHVVSKTVANDNKPEGKSDGKEK